MNEGNDSGIPPAPPPPPTPPPPIDSGTGLTPNVAAGLAAVFPLVAGIVFLILEKRNAFVRFWAMQSIYFGVASLVLSVAVTVAGMVLAFIPILGWVVGGIMWLVVYVAILILWIMGIVKSFQGQVWKMPVIGEMVEKQLGSLPPDLSPGS